MQDYILDPRNKLKIDRIKLALTHLEASDIAKEEFDLDRLSGYVEPFFGLVLVVTTRGVISVGFKTGI